MKAHGRKRTSSEVVVTPELMPDDVYEKIALRAYQIFERRGGETGHDLEDWLEAERSVRDEAVRPA
jgi:hypothetical protein